MKQYEFKRIIPPNKNALEAQEGFDEFWKQCGLVCHMTPTDYDITFDQIYHAIQNYYLAYPRETKVYHDETDVALALVRLIEWGLIEIVEKNK